MTDYLPEGAYIDKYENRRWQKNEDTLRLAMNEGKILESIAVMCDAAHDLWIDFGFMRGVIRRNEGAVGIEDGTVRDIALITRVNKPVCYKVIGFSCGEDGRKIAELSRKRVQQQCMENYISRLRCGDIIDARVTHLEPFGAFVDIGCGIASLIPIDSVSVSRISHPKDRFYIGMRIKAVVKQIEQSGRILLSHKELLGTWKQNSQKFSAGETVSGIVRSVEDYGIFVELAPNLAGLAELKEDIYAGQTVSVYIKAIISERMKVKLIIIDSGESSDIHKPLHYYIDSGRLNYWRYSPEECQRIVDSRFE